MADNDFTNVKWDCVLDFPRAVCDVQATSITRKKAPALNKLENINAAHVSGNPMLITSDVLEYANWSTRSKSALHCICVKPTIKAIA